MTAGLLLLGIFPHFLLRLHGAGIRTLLSHSSSWEDQAKEEGKKATNLVTTGAESQCNMVEADRWIEQISHFLKQDLPK